MKTKGLISLRRCIYAKFNVHRYVLRNTVTKHSVQSRLYDIHCSPYVTQRFADKGYEYAMYHSGNSPSEPLEFKPEP